MEIKAIKAQLPLLEVVARYGLKPDKYHRLHCPFHDDKTPSLQLYPKTDTFCCFSSNCTAGTGDVIRFIELMEKSTKHQAILKAQSFLEGTNPIIAPQSKTTPPPTATNDADVLEKEALMMEAFAYFKKSLPRAAGAVAYLEGRGIRYQDHEIGYNSGGMHHESKNRYLVEGLVRYGLLKPKAASGYSVWAKNCVIFPLKSREGKTVSLYGRSITNNDTARHFYVSGREGLYPHYQFS
jgi:DNA primase